MQSYIDKTTDYFAHARTEIAPLLPAHCGRVLELGCGSGATLGWLRQSLKTSRTVGIEIAEAAASAARAHADEVYWADFEHDRVTMVTDQFDVILCLDVLEHMVNPWAIVDRLVTEHLAPGGLMIASVPNVRHYNVVLPLLFGGRWDYAEAGPLDRTHLRFFTRNSALQLLTHTQLSTPSCSATGFDGFSKKQIVNALTLGLFREFVTYQYYLTARKVAS
jgi:2-polyprenyl-3-methyl-5-hydroxy-6-metoxy-1,4-benzoquinol methylase